MNEPCIPANGYCTSRIGCSSGCSGDCGSESNSGSRGAATAIDLTPF
ncbi:MAG: hypothetical protein WB308_10355 [Sulfuricurvum sp.]